jgi:type VI secretion system protein ImpH
MPALAAGRFNVFQLVRLLRRDGQAVRFAADLAAGFPAREVSSLTEDSRTGKPQPKLTTANFCLAGTLGPLPEPFTEWLREQARRNDSETIDFLDMFNQRLHVLRHDLKARQLPELNSDDPEDSVFAHYVASLVGLGSTALTSQVDLPPRAWLALAALLGNGRRSAHDIGRALALLLNAQVRVEQFVGAWRPIEKADRTLLGRANHRLGYSTALGRRVWDQQARLRLTIGGLSYRRARAMLPPEPRRAASPEHRHLCSFVRLLVDRELDCEVLLGVRPGQVPRAWLEGRPDRSRYAGLRLGQTAWLNQAPAEPFAPFLIPADPHEEAA